VEQAIEALAGEIQRSLDFYLATSGSPRFDRILIAGGTSNSKFLPQAIARRAGVTVERLDPLFAAPAKTLNVNLEGVSSHLVQGAIAFGLAMRKDKEVRG
jgi:type IV pilus assembly protein PilM